MASGTIRVRITDADRFRLGVREADRAMRLAAKAGRTTAEFEAQMRRVAVLLGPLAGPLVPELTILVQLRALPRWRLVQAWRLWTQLREARR